MATTARSPGYRLPLWERTWPRQPFAAGQQDLSLFREKLSRPGPLPQ